MTSNSDSIDVSLSGFYKSWYAFRQGKRLSRSIIAFEYNLENNLDLLANDIQNNHYRHGGYRHMQVNDSKPRDIAVAQVRDRVVHRLLYDYFVPRMDPHFDYDVWSCRTGKGLDAGVDRVKTLLNRYPNSWAWRGDVSKFFDSVDQEIAMRIVRRFIKDEIALRVLGNVISSYETAPGRGISIGNLTSQILANVYLNELDRYVRHTIKPLAYVRYGDDFVLLLPSKAEAQKTQSLGATFLDQALHLTLHKTNNIVVPVRQGIHFLGLKLYPSGRLIRKPTWNRLRNRIEPRNLSSYDGFVKQMGSEKQQRAFRWVQHKAGFDFHE